MTNLFARNLDYLEEQYPPLLSAIKTTNIHAEYEKDAPDLSNQQRLDEQAIAIKAIESTLQTQLNKQTQRILLPRLNSSELASSNNQITSILANSVDATTSYLVESLPNLSVEKYNSSECSKYLAKDAIMMGCLGLVGIENIITKMSLNTLLVVDDGYETLAQLMTLVDFKKVITACKSRNISLRFVIESKYEQVIERIKYELACSMFTAIFGLNVLISPPGSAVLEAVVEWLKAPQGLTEFLKGLLGQETDEINQSLHAIYNFRSYKNRKILSFNPNYEKDVIVVASGPSLDERIDELKSIANQITIISAGSAIGALLRNQIKVQYAVLLEMSSDVFRDMCQLIAEGFDLSEITLIASITIDPRIASLFGGFITFQRPVSTAAVFFENEEDSTLPYAGPQAVNAAFEVAWAMNPRSITLVGCDLSSPDNAQLRSSDAVGLSPRDFDIPMFGTNNKTVFTDSGLLMTKEGLEATMNLCSCPVYRVGHGIPINSDKVQLVESIMYLIESKLILLRENDDESVTQGFCRELTITDHDINAIKAMAKESISDFQAFKAEALELLRKERKWSLNVSNYFSRALSMADRDIPRVAKIYRRMFRLPLFFSLQPLHDASNDDSTFEALIDDYEQSLSLMYDVFVAYMSVLDKIFSMNSLPPYDPKFVALMID